MRMRRNFHDDDEELMDDLMAQAGLEVIESGSVEAALEEPPEEADETEAEAETPPIGVVTRQDAVPLLIARLGALAPDPTNALAETAPSGQPGEAGFFTRAMVSVGGRLDAWRAGRARDALVEASHAASDLHRSLQRIYSDPAVQPIAARFLGATSDGEREAARKDWREAFHTRFSPETRAAVGNAFQHAMVLEQSLEKSARRAAKGGVDPNALRSVADGLVKELAHPSGLALCAMESGSEGA